jgi:hypothetical protein
MPVPAHSLMVVSEFLRLGHLYIKEIGPMKAIDAKHSYYWYSSFYWICSGIGASAAKSFPIKTTPARKENLNPRKLKKIVMLDAIRRLQAIVVFMKDK